MPHRLPSCVPALLAAFVLAGCCCCCATKPVPVERPAYTPTYAELVSKHNNRVKDIKSFWSRTTVEVRWTDADGKRRFEQGQGHLVLDLPYKSYLSLGKLDQTRLWAGSNETYFWLFDQLEGNTLYLGRQDGRPLDMPSDYSQRSSPLPVRPVDIPALLGILPIPELREGQPVPEVKWQDTSFIIEPPGMHMRFYYHPIHYQVLHVALLNRAGEPVLISKLENPKRIEVVDALLGPYINTRIAVTKPGQPGGMTLFLTEMTNDPQRVNPKLFDLDYHRNTKKPDTVVAIESR